MPKDMEERREMAKKPKVAPVIANKALMAENTLKMERMLKGMSLDQTKSGIQGKLDLDSDSEGHMEVDEASRAMAQPTKVIAKTKKRNREYYQQLKKSLRRGVKDGRLPDPSKLDRMIADLKREVGPLTDEMM